MNANGARAPLFCSQRLTWVILTFFGNVFLYSAKVNLSVAIICMVGSDDASNSTYSLRNSQGNISETYFIINVTSAINSEEGSLTKPNTRGELDWTKSMQSHLLSMYFYGYICTQIIGGWMSARFGGRRVWGAAHFISAICTILTPVCARTHIYLAYFVRFALGFVSGVSFPTLHTLMGRWAPPLERSRLVSMTVSGIAVGLILTMPISGFLCDYGFDNGWASIFYLCGGFYFIWVVIWLSLTADTPAQHKRITERERSFIDNSIGIKEEATIKLKVPWLKMMTSGPVWAVILASLCNNYISDFLLTSLPMFMKEALKFDIKQNGVLSSLPSIAQVVGSWLMGYAADYFVQRRFFKVTNTRKLFQCTSQVGTAICLMIVVYIDASRRYVAVVILCVANFVRSAYIGGYAVNLLDMAPRYAGLLFGFTNTTASIGGIVAPVIVGALTPNKTIDEWRQVFYVCAAVCMFGSIAYAVLGDGEIQPWAKEQGDSRLNVEMNRKENTKDKNNGDNLIEGTNSEVLPLSKSNTFE